MSSKALKLQPLEKEKKNTEDQHILSILEILRCLALSQVTLMQGCLKVL